MKLFFFTNKNKLYYIMVWLFKVEKLVVSRSFEGMLNLLDKHFHGFFNFCLGKSVDTTGNITISIYIVVNFSSQVIVLFLLFLAMLMYANGVETKEKQNLPEIKK